MSSVHGSSSADASAAAWAGATLEAAENYAQEQANRAAAERDLAEQQAQAGGGDSVAPPPTAEDRAQAAFWEHDPNRPTPSGGSSGTPSGSGSSSSGSGGPGGTPTPLTPEEVAAFQNKGLVVTPAGNGTYTVTTPPEGVTLTESTPPPLQAPDTTHWIPDLAGSPTSPPPTTPPTTAPEEPPATTGPEAAGNDPVEPEEVATTKKPTKKDIDRAIKNGDYEKAVELASKLTGIKAVYDPKVEGEGIVRADGVLRIGKDAFTFEDSKTGATRPASAGWLASSLQHEATHQAQREPGPNYRWGRDGTQGGFINQAEAYKTELDNAKKNGLSRSEIAELERRYNEQLDTLRPNYREQVERGDFSVPEVYQNPPEP